jgi:hypothetical protein
MTDDYVVSSHQSRYRLVRWDRNDIPTTTSRQIDTSIRTKISSFATVPSSSLVVRTLRSTALAGLKACTTHDAQLKNDLKAEGRAAERGWRAEGRLSGSPSTVIARANGIHGREAKARRQNSESPLSCPGGATEPGAFPQRDRPDRAVMRGDDAGGRVRIGTSAADLTGMRKRHALWQPTAQADQKNESRERREAHYINHITARVHSRQATVGWRIIDGCTRSTSSSP